MTTLREAAQQALEALESAPLDHNSIKSRFFERRHNAITALRSALAEPVQEPVAWMHVPHPGNGISPTVSLIQQREPSLYAASVPLYLKEQL